MADGTTRTLSGRGLVAWLKARTDVRSRAPTSRPNTAAAGTTKPEGIERRFFERMRDEGEIARGGMGAIRRVLDTNLRRRVALKVLDPALAHDAASVQRFHDEAQITGQLDHPNIVPVYDFSADHEGTRYLAMKLVRGETLAQLLRSQRFSARTWENTYELLTIFAKLCDAVAFAHARGVVHRDLKPDNVMVAPFGQVYLMDWGIAKLIGDRRKNPDDEPPVSITEGHADLDAPGAAIGTLFYMSPEQARGDVDATDERTDVFGLGAILYEILVRVPPIFQRTTLETLMQAQRAAILPPDVMDPDAEVPRELSRITMKALALDPADRHQDVLALKRDIEAFLRGGGSFPARAFAPGEALMREGERGEVAFIITKGTVEVVQGCATLARLGAGSVVGEAAVLTDKPRMASVIALDEVHAVEVSRDALEREIGVGSWMGALVRSLAERLHNTDARVQRSQAAAWLFQYVALYGVDVDGARAVRWAPLSAAATAQLRIDVADLHALIASIPTLDLDEERDLLVAVR